MSSLVGRHLGDYLLEAELGRGTMGVVYRAQHVTTGHPFAVKALIPALSADLTFVTRFMREAAVAAQLRHPNIVRVYESGRQDQHIYFVMEYFVGVTAGHMLRERKRLPALEVIEIAAQAASALHYAHVEGRLVHRDVKPENMLVDRWRRAKLLDFGLARIEGMDGITRAGAVVGSLYYVSPEQLLGRKLDGRSDVYALGISMYEMLTGQRPYRGQSLTEMSDAILYATAIPARQLEPSTPPDLERIIARAMARDISQRYADAGQLCEDLRMLQARLGGPSRHDQPEGMDQSARPGIGSEPLGHGEPPRTLRHTFRPASLEPATNPRRPPRTEPR
ncbi:MAG TPA: serine/threonine-protein kinase [Ktedonobacterales bacterium]|nr:serine/threonine-protein kinase [Ktedonobacterales bacterium]